MTTNPRGTGHAVAVKSSRSKQGLVRKKIEEGEQIFSKKGRKVIGQEMDEVNQGSGLKPQVGTSSTKEEPEEELDEITLKLMKALTTNAISNILVNKIKSALDTDLQGILQKETRKATEAMQNEITEMKDTQETQNQNVTDIDKRVDELEQMKKKH